MNEEAGGERSGESLPSVVSDAIDVIGDAVTGIPAPLRKNAAKVFTRLCTAAVEYPVTLIEGAIAERRAELRARVKLIETSADQIAAQMQTNPEYARAAVAKFGQKILRERANIDQIVQIAAEELKSEPLSNEPEQPEASSISDDWLNVFETEAAPMTSEQMKKLFGKILSGEIRRPQSYSIKTIRLVAQVDNRVAALFRLLCSLSVSIRIHNLPNNLNPILDAHVVLMGNAGDNSLRPYGLGFDALNILHEYGLIIADYNSYVDYRTAVVHTVEHGPVPASIPAIYQNAPWVFVPKTARDISQDFRVVGVAFSTAGKELLPIMEITPNEDYTAALQKFFDQEGMTLTRISPAG